jgi:hypothetical protein
MAVLSSRCHASPAETLTPLPGTQPCQRIVYELCQAGGLLFVRRFYRSDEVLVHESEWLRAPEAERLWIKILMGQMR